MKKTVRKNDLLLLVPVMLLCILTIFTARSKAPGKTVVVTVENQEIYRLSLSEDTELLIRTGSGENLLVIEKGEVYIKRADCATQVCVNTGRISGEGEMIVCLPHKVVVTVEGEK